ncbi:MAG TPA: hypothetical protein VFC09_07370 [Candidatus Dormibacteraeota bacterium]|nr:hypothetical protein [Candidatus Dormibacteraeota bacterium]
MTKPARLRRRRAHLPLRAAFALAAALTACGPSVPLDAGVQQQPVAIGFGVQGRPSPSVAAAQPIPYLVNITPNFPAPLVVPPLPLPGLVIPPQVPPPPCPSAPLTAFPAIPADITPGQPPVGATYQFRYSGTEVFNPNTPQAKSVQLPATGTRTVTNVSPVQSDGSWTFDVVETYNGSRVTTTYHVVPNGTSAPQAPQPPQQTLIASPSPSPPPPQNGNLQSGLFLQSMTDARPDGSSDVFHPTPEVLLMPFPAQQALVYQGGGVDGSNREAMEEDPQGGVIHDRARVDACGTVLDSWQAEIQGQMGDARTPASPASKTFDLTIDVGTQFGGLLLGEHLVEKGTDDDSGQPFTYDLTATIDSAPKQSQVAQ